MLCLPISNILPADQRILVVVFLLRGPCSVSNWINDILKNLTPGSGRDNSVAPLSAGETLLALILFLRLDESSIIFFFFFSYCEFLQ